ncbi:MAG: MFS transporter, partial [Gammaproteobacteria bacterium]|nr:MFS transporter [Gammaproteobacteria bacterium]
MLKKYLRKQDTPGAWIIVFSATLFFFFESILVNLFGTLSKDMMNAFHIDAFGLGKLSASYLFANILLLFPAGILLDRFSIKKILLLAVLTSATASAFLYHTSNIHLAMICVFVSGLGGTFCFLGTMKLASRWFTPKKLALVTGFVVMSAMLGGFVAQTPVAYLAEHAGWRSAFLVLSSFEFLLFIWLSLSLENWPIERPHSSGESIQHLKHSIKIALSTPLNWLCGFFTSALNLPVTLLGAIWGVPLLMQAHGFDRVTASSINSMIFLGMMIGSPLSGWVSDRCRSRLLPMTIGSILSLLLILFLIFAPTQTATAYSLLF